VKKYLFAMMIFFSITGVATERDTVGQMVALEIAAVKTGQAAPKLTASGFDFSVDDAYRVQTGLFFYLFPHRDPDGYKGGLTGEGDPQRFGLDEPLAGVLPPASSLTPVDGQYVLNMAAYHRAMMEMELGFLFSKSIYKGPVSIEELKNAVSAVVPVLELPDLGFVGEGKLHGKDIIAANASAKYYIRGLLPLAKSVDINKIVLKLYRNDELVVQGAGRDAMGDQWLALQWLVNQRLSTGWTIRQKQLLITGAIGKMIALKPGQYRAEFGEQASIHLQVR